LSEIVEFLLSLVKDYGYLGAFIGSILGNITIALPIPYAFLVAALGTKLNPFILGLVSGLGATIGELSSYLLGRAGRRALNPQQLSRLDVARRLLDRYGYLTIILFAVTPLPDDLLLVPLGLMNYDLKTLAVSVWIGKTVLALALAYAGYYGSDYLSIMYTSAGWTGIALTLVSLAIVTIALVKLDWEKILEKL